MENGNYKSSDTNVSTEDWIALNFRAVDSSIVQAVIGDEGYDMLTRVDLEAPEEPDEVNDDAAGRDTALFYRDDGGGSQGPYDTTTIEAQC